MSSSSETSLNNDASPHPSQIKSLVRKLAFLDITEEDRERLRALAPILNEQGTVFVESFYRHLFKFEETAHFLKDSELVERLKLAQQRHLESMLAADWDDGYVDRRYRVGDAHAQVGISPQIFLARTISICSFACGSCRNRSKVRQKSVPNRC